MEFRKAGKTDAKILFEWANDPDTRKNSFSTAQIAWEEHVKWLDVKIADPDCFFYIAVSGDKPCGTIRVDMDREKRQGCISYTVAPEFRGRGMGSGIIKLIDRQILEDFGRCTLIAEVKNSNHFSTSIFLKNGYVCENSGDETVRYSKKI